MQLKFSVKICFICILCVALSLCVNNLCLDINASANTTNNSAELLPQISVTHRHTLKATAVDKTDLTNGFHVTVNVTNATSIFAFCNEPVSWTLEWQILRDDYTVYTASTRTGVFLSSIASQSEDFYARPLQYGYLRYRLIMVSHGVKTYSDWGECYASPNGGGGGGQHRIGAA